MKSVWCCVLVCLLSTQSLAIECPGGSISGEARLAELAQLLDREGQASSRWALVWGGLYGLLTIGQLAIAPLFPAEERPDWYWGAGSAAVGVLFTVLDPPQILVAGPQFARRAARAPPEEVCTLLAEGERLLQVGAQHQRDSTRWYLHAGNVLFNVALGLVLGLGYKHWGNAALNMAVGTVVGELTIFTLPTGLHSALHVRPAGMGLALSF